MMIIAIVVSMCGVVGVGLICKALTDFAIEMCECGEK